MDLMFINFSDPNEIKTRDARKLVRSHAMQHFRSQQRLDIRKGTHALPYNPMTIGPLPEHTHHISSERAQRQYQDPDEDEYRVCLDRRCGETAKAERREPFSLYPISTSQKFFFTIFEHYGNAVAGGLLPLGKNLPTNPLRTRVLPLVNYDTALFHIILANAGMDMMTWRGEQFFDPVTRSYIRGRERGTVFCMKHKMEAIRIINERLNDPFLSISNETILAVSHLASFEMLASATKRPEDRFEEFKVHMEGIEQMVKLRGGLKAIGLSTCLTLLVLRVDHLYSALTGNQPRFTIEDIREESYDLASRFPFVQFPELVTGISNPALLEVLYQLCLASQFLENLKDPIAESDFFSFGIKRAHIEETLFRLGNVNVDPSRDTLSPIEQCYRFAALLYVQTALTKVNCKVYRDLVATLRNSIEQVGLEACFEMNPNLLLWMLLVGGGAAPYNIDRPWFIKSIQRILHTTLWKEVEQRLQGWPWRPKYCGPWRMIWRDAVNSVTV